MALSGQALFRRAFGSSRRRLTPGRSPARNRPPVYTASAAPAAGRAPIVEPLEERALFARSLGIDVSAYQPTINWASVKAGGRDFAFIKATEGATFTSSTFANQMTGAKNAGVLAGAYHFARYDNNSAAAEAQHFLNVAGPYVTAGYLRPVLDVETSTTQTKTAVSNWVNAWCTAVQNATGVAPIVYTFVSYASTYLNSSVTQWPLWMAQYPSSPNPQTGNPSGTAPWATGAWSFWQYTDNATVSGISDGVDGNAYNGDLTSLKANFQIGASTTPKFTAGQTVKVTGTTSGLRAWDSAASNGTYVTKPEGAIGTVVSGPVFAAGYNRYEVRWQGETVTRWSAEDFLAIAPAPAAATSPTPANGASFKPATAPTTLDWADAANALSYDVYLDGALQATVSTSAYTLTAAPGYGPHTWSVTARNGTGSTAGATWNFYVGKFLPGERVTVTNAPSGLRAWDTAASNGTYVLKANNSLATVVSGPVFAAGYWRWELRYDGDTVNRWSSEDYLTGVV